MDLDALNTDVSIGCRARRGRIGCIGVDRWELPPSLPVFTALVFHKEESVPPTSVRIQISVTLNATKPRFQPERLLDKNQFIAAILLGVKLWMCPRVM